MATLATGQELSRAPDTHLVERLVVVLGEAVGGVGRLARLANEFPRLELDLGHLLLEVVEPGVGVTVDLLEREAALEGLEAVQEGEREGLGALVERREVRALFDVGVRGRERVLDEGVARHL